VELGDGNDRLSTVNLLNSPEVLAFGREGNDTLLGGPGNDSLRGNDGDDTVDGGDGNDDVMGNTGNDTVAGGAGSDRVDFSLSFEYDFNNGTDKLAGGPGDDELYGGHDLPLAAGLPVVVPTSPTTSVVEMGPIRRSSAVEPRRSPSLSTVEPTMAKPARATTCTTMSKT
jgi:hypothetical protein